MIPGLDAIRASAIFLVFGFHFLLLPSGSGSLGVMMFFVLSGFLITRLLLVEYAGTGAISLAQFYRRRAYRIFPVFYVCWGIETLLMHLHGTRLSWWEPVTSFFYLTDYARAFTGFDRVQHMNIAWSLAVEEQFYLLWPAALLWLLRRTRNVAYWLSAFVLAIWIHRCVLFLVFHVSWAYIYNAFDTRLDALLIGALTALASSDIRFSRALQVPLKSAWLGAVTAGALALSLASDAWLMKHPALQILNFTLQPVIIAVLLVQVVHFGLNTWRIVDHRALRFVAAISYSLYLIHALVLGEGSRLTLSGFPGRVLGIRILDVNNHPRILLLVFPAIALSIASYYFVEKPFMRFRDRKRKVHSHDSSCLSSLPIAPG